MKLEKTRMFVPTVFLLEPLISFFKKQPAQIKEERNEDGTFWNLREKREFKDKGGAIR